MSAPTDDLRRQLAESLARPVDPAVADFARELAKAEGAIAVLFYGSNLRTGSLEGVLDFYVILPGGSEPAIWPTVSYHERAVVAGTAERSILRAKVAKMRLRTFARAARGELADTTIWTRFVQPCALVWAIDDATRKDLILAIGDACKTASRLAVALGPRLGTSDEYWSSLFRATYEAELRVESCTRSDTILDVNRGHFTGLLPLALAASGIDPREHDGLLEPELPQSERRRILGWWKRRRRLGKVLNLVRILKASTTFAGAARYAAWKIERHTGLKIEVTPLRERFPLVAAPGVLWALWRHRRRA